MLRQGLRRKTKWYTICDNYRGACSEVLFEIPLIRSLFVSEVIKIFDKLSV